jgi:hypothetical protein
MAPGQSKRKAEVEMMEVYDADLLFSYYIPNPKKRGLTLQYAKQQLEYARQLLVLNRIFKNPDVVYHVIRVTCEAGEYKSAFAFLEFVVSSKYISVLAGDRLVRIIVAYAGRQHHFMRENMSDLTYGDMLWNLSTVCTCCFRDDILGYQTEGVPASWKEADPFRFWRTCFKCSIAEVGPYSTPFMFRMLTGHEIDFSQSRNSMIVNDFCFFDALDISRHLGTNLLIDPKGIPDQMFYFNTIPRRSSPLRMLIKLPGSGTHWQLVPVAKLSFI